MTEAALPQFQEGGLPFSAHLEHGGVKPPLQLLAAMADHIVPFPTGGAFQVMASDTDILNPDAVLDLASGTELSGDEVRSEILAQ